MKNLGISKAALQSSKIIYLLAAFVIILVVHLGTEYKLKDTNQENAKLFAAIVDEDKSAESELAKKRFIENPAVNAVEYTQYDEALNDLLRQKVEAVFVIKPGFKDKIKSGNIKKIVDLQYLPGSVTAEIIGENFAREVLRIFLSEKTLQDIESQYKKENMEFSEEMGREATGHTENYWKDKMTVTMDISYIDSEIKPGEEQGLSFRNIGIDIMVDIVIFIMILQFAGEMIAQKTSGLINRLRVDGVGDTRAAFMWIGSKTTVIFCLFALTAILCGTLGTTEMLLYALQFIAAAAAAIALCKLPNSKLLFSFIPLTAILMALLKSTMFLWVYS